MKKILTILFMVIGMMCNAQQLHITTDQAQMFNVVNEKAHHIITLEQTDTFTLSGTGDNIRLTQITESYNIVYKVVGYVMNDDEIILHLETSTGLHSKLLMDTDYVTILSKGILVMYTISKIDTITVCNL